MVFEESIDADKEEIYNASALFWHKHNPKKLAHKIPRPKIRLSAKNIFTSSLPFPLVYHKRYKISSKKSLIFQNYNIIRINFYFLLYTIAEESA